MKKTLASVLTLLLVALMVFAGFVPVISYAAENEPAPASISVSDAVSSVTDWFVFEKQGNELIVTLNPDVDSLKQIDKEELKAILGKVLEYAKDVIKTTYNDEEFRAAIWQIACDSYLAATKYNSLEEAIANGEDLAKELLGYAKSAILAAHEAGIIDAYELKLYALDVKDRVVALLEKAKDKLDSKLEAYIEKEIAQACDEFAITEEQLEILANTPSAELDAKLAEFGVAAEDYEKAKELIANTDIILDGELSLVDIFNIVEGISVNGYSVYAAPEGEKAEIDVDGIKSLLRSIPTFEELANMTDAQMQESLFTVSVELDTIYGTKEFSFTAKVGSGAEYIRTAAAFLDRYFTFDYKNGTFVVEVNVPAALSNALVKAANSDAIDPALKQKVFNAFMADGKDFQSFINGLDVDDLYTLLDYVDFGEIFDSEYVKQFVDLSKYDNDDIAAVVEKYEHYFAAAFKACIKLTNTVANRIPAKYMDDSFMDLIKYQDNNDKFSYSEGTFRYEGSRHITYEYVEGILESFAELLGKNKDLASAALSLLPAGFYENGYTLKVDLSVNVEEINRVDFMVDGNVYKSGFLPEGTVLAYFVPAPNGYHWDIEIMPDNDVVVNAVSDNSGNEPDEPEVKENVIKPSDFQVVYTDANGNMLDNYVYDGTEKEINSILCTFNGEDITDCISYTLSGVTKATNAGNYYLTVNAEVVSGDYELEESTFELEWNIAKKQISFSGVGAAWDTTNSFVYNGEFQAITVVLEGDKADMLVPQYSYTDEDGNAVEAPTNVGKYFASVVFELVDEYANNYAIDDLVDLDPAEFTITPASLDLSNEEWQWENVGTHVYTGKEQGVKLVNPYPGIIDFTYTGNSGVDANDYNAVATVVLVNNNYTLEGTVPTPTKAWSIAKQTLVDPTLTLPNKTIVYDGLTHGFDRNDFSGNADVIAKLDFAFSGTGYARLGKYTVSATATVKPEFANNYSYYNEFTADLIITGDKKLSFEVKDGSGVIVTVEPSQGLDPDYILKGFVEAYYAGKTYEIDKDTFEILVAYSISFTRILEPDNADVNVDGQTFKVKMLIPSEYLGLDAEDLRVLYIKEDGTVEVIEATRDGIYMCFETDHFSTYAIARAESRSLLWLWIILAILLVAGIAVAVFFFLKSKKDKTPAPEAEAKTETAQVEEPKTEEPAEEATEEAPAEEVEEPKTEEPAEEPVEEEPEVEEEAPAAEPVSEPATAVLVMGEDGKEATAIIDGQVVHIRFRSSFMSRLIQSTENIQGFYSVIKNHILSYKGIKVRSSWNYEAFNKGRVQLVKLNIKGKTLIVNLNLDPKEFNINKYHFIDCSDKPKFEKVPMMMKVRSARALKYTLELIDEMMAKNGLVQGEIPTVDYSMPYETTEELAKRGLVKVILPAGVTLSDDMTFVQMNVSELIESGTNEKTTEQLMANEKLVTVEAPVAETEHKVEILEDGTVHADAEFADQLISDEEAEAKVEVVHVEGASRTGKMGEINLDIICENFEDGEVVDVDSLKSKRLISSKTGRVKVLARGVMYKKLTVKASKFSIQAVKMITLAGGKAEREE